jgi:hypothetical protein
MSSVMVAVSSEESTLLLVSCYLPEAHHIARCVRRMPGAESLRG